MALKLNITNNKGITTTYHRIDEVVVRKNSNEKYSLMVQMMSYVNEIMRRVSTHNFVETKTYEIICTAEEIENQSVIKICYDKLKNRSVFDGAEDC